MVLSRRPRPALIVPDELSWTVWGTDPAERGLAPASAPEHARGLLVPEVIPAALAGPFEGAVARLPQRPLVIAGRGPLVQGPHVAELLRGTARPSGHGQEQHDRAGQHAHRPARGHDEQQDDDGEHDHDPSELGYGDEHDHGDEHGHDMMAIVGEPSGDGLVMEPIELELGPLSWILPGGLVASLRLDGDLVASCELRSTLLAASEHGAPASDPLAPVAWSVAASVATEQATGAPAAPAVAWRRIAAVELERAVSHLAWLRSLGRLLGWGEFVVRAQRALDPVLEIRRDARLEGAREGSPRRSGERRWASAAKRARKLADLLDGRRLAARARGRGGLEPVPFLSGPNGRAAGSTRDARGDDPLYRALGFEPVVRQAGDAEARVLVRADEAVAALALATDALARASANERGFEGVGFASPAGAAVEGPRGPVLASTPAPRVCPIVAAPGGEATMAAAATAATGEEWSAALLTLVSFDLSGWRVSG